MDGTKHATDTLNPERGRREVSCGGRSLSVSLGGPRENKNLADSNSKVG